MNASSNDTLWARHARRGTAARFGTTWPLFAVGLVGSWWTVSFPAASAQQADGPTAGPPATATTDGGTDPADAAFEQQLNAAKKLASQGQRDQALELLKELRGRAPSLRLDRETRSLDLDVEFGAEQHAAFKSAVENLGGDLATSRAAEEALWSNPRLAARALGDQLRSEPPGPRLVRGLDMLRRLRSPEAVREVVHQQLNAGASAEVQAALERLVAAPPGVGLGQRLLEVALWDSSGHRPPAAWKLLVVVPDPPADVLTAVAGNLDRPGGPLATMLLAAANGARVNRQTDLVGLRNFPELTAEQQHTLAALPEKLRLLREQKAETPEERAIVAAANDLSATLGLTAFAPLPNVKIMGAAAGQDAGKTAVLLDGEWGSLEQTKSWRPRHDDVNWLVLDLGEEKIVDGVRLWNHNVRGQSHESWKVAEIYVGDDPSELRLAGQGVVARAPTKEDSADFGTTIVIAPTRGRFVRLVNRVAWSGNKLAGLSEVQVLGRDP